MKVHNSIFLNYVANAILQSMKWRFLYLLLIIILLAGCQSAKKNSERDLMKEEEQRELLITSVEDAIFLTDRLAFSEKANYNFNSTFRPYEEKLAEFRSLEDDYRAKLSEILSSCIPEISVLLLDELENVDFTNPDEYISSGYVSISAILIGESRERTLLIISRTIEEHKAELDSIYAEMKIVADNWKANLENLSLVGIAKNVDEIVEPTVSELSHWARDEYFTLLGDNEVSTRYRKVK